MKVINLKIALYKRPALIAGLFIFINQTFVVLLSFRCVALLYALLNTVQKDEVSDTTGDDTFTAVCSQKIFTCKEIVKLLHTT